MRKIIQIVSAILLLIIFFACKNEKKSDPDQSVHLDVPFLQDYSIKYYFNEPGNSLLKVVSDRNGYIQILSSKGLMRLRDGQFLFPGTIVKDIQDRQTSDKKISGIGIYQDQLVYVDDKAVLSNAWAGKLFSRHTTPGC